MSNITCYGYDGAPYPNNFLCPNSDACCGNISFCTGQRLCLATNGELIRPACRNTPYTVDTCAQLCLFDENGGNGDETPDGYFLPRLTLCANSSFCCGLNNTACCDAGQGVFLDSVGQIVSKSSSSTSSSTSVSSSSSSTSSPATTASSFSASATNSVPAIQTTAASSRLTTGAKAGIGVGVSVAAVVFIVLLVLFFFRQKRSKSARSGAGVGGAEQDSSTAMNGPYEVGNDGYANNRYKDSAMPMQRMDPAVEMSAHTYQPSEMQG